VHDNLRAARAGDAEGIHQLRVALRRLRSILGVFAPALPDAERRAFGGMLKDAAHRLTRARALDVFLGTTAAAMRRAMPEDRALRRLEAAARTDAYAALPAEIVPTPTLLAIAAWAEGGLWRDGPDDERRAALDAPLAGFARDVLRRRHRRLKRRVDGHGEPSLETLHKLRIEAKRTRYAAEAFQSLFRAKASRRYLAALERLQDVLGAVNDASAARAVAASLPGRSARAQDLVAGWTACEIEHGRRAFAAAWRSFRRVKPFWRA
jgi:CHAD domain-containing protein